MMDCACVFEAANACLKESLTAGGSGAFIAFTFSQHSLSCPSPVHPCQLMSWNPFAKKNAAEQQPAATAPAPARNTQHDDDFEDIEVTKRRWEERRRLAMEERSKREGAGAAVEKPKEKQSAMSRHFTPCATQMVFGSGMGVAVGLSTGMIVGILMGPAGHKVPMAIKMAKQQAMFFGGIFGIGGGLQYAKAYM